MGREFTDPPRLRRASANRLRGRRAATAEGPRAPPPHRRRRSGLARLARVRVNASRGLEWPIARDLERDLGDALSGWRGQRRDVPRVLPRSRSRSRRCPRSDVGPRKAASCRVARRSRSQGDTGEDRAGVVGHRPTRRPGARIPPPASGAAPRAADRRENRTFCPLQVPPTDLSEGCGRRGEQGVQDAKSWDSTWHAECMTRGYCGPGGRGGGRADPWRFGVQRSLRGVSFGVGSWTGGDRTSRRGRSGRVAWSSRSFPRR